MNLFGFFVREKEEKMTDGSWIDRHERKKEKLHTNKQTTESILNTLSQVNIEKKNIFNFSFAKYHVTCLIKFRGK